ncbi:uncharacterized protein EURHEDRAFT_408467 [Aspergillus ruber CBS 135680]|uniref:Uncharacterized protein n=1 Tax=Aspergillus ruber (strain CBS 135680) TaxID=1388766 RepID=A0A017SQG5_ASPRC|nr:uncharacterized protein EURHEDRAFT_408467 [Aspergillus ruber CBS 135680]EYE99202.1 hypothetical protein EURHEDRAFT_408467 [Aspergillus ruber CBS 135680]
MKITPFLIAILPALVSANVGLSWSIANVSSSGLKDITFPMAMPNAKHEGGLYFAQQFDFVGADGVGYTGLQPMADTSNGSMVHAVFSSFVAGTKSTDTENCSDGADGGPGVSCAIEIPAPYSHPYNLVIKNTHGTTWTGTLVDAVLGNATRIGSYTLPAGSGGVGSSQAGFVEYFLFNVEDAEEKGECGKVPRADVTFWPPRTNTSRFGVGELSEPHAYSGCEEEGNFKTTQVNGGGYRITVGYV